MSELVVLLRKVTEVFKHPNADRLEIIKVSDSGWSFIVQKDSLKLNDLVLYIPIDSILSPELESLIFGENSKIKLKNSRVKTIKIRGIISQGLCVPYDKLKDTYPNLSKKDSDYNKKTLGITKFKIPDKPSFSPKQGQQAKKKDSNPNFKKYVKINHFDNMPFAFDGKYVEISEKIHGTSFRAGYIPVSYTNFINRFWTKIINRWFKKSKYPGYEFLVGSRNVQLKSKDHIKKWKKYNPGLKYTQSVYERIAKRYRLEHKLLPSEVVYGEIFGPSIQKGYHYGLKNVEIDFVMYDFERRLLSEPPKFVSYHAMATQAKYLGMKTAPILYSGIFDEGIMRSLVSGRSILNNTQKYREGIVIKTHDMADTDRQVLKVISPEYLLKVKTTEWK